MPSKAVRIFSNMILAAIFIVLATICAIWQDASAGEMRMPRGRRLLIDRNLKNQENTSKADPVEHINQRHSRSLLKSTVVCKHDKEDEPFLQPVSSADKETVFR